MVERRERGQVVERLQQEARGQRVPDRVLPDGVEPVDVVEIARRVVVEDRRLVGHLGHDAQQHAQREQQGEQPVPPQQRACPPSVPAQAAGRVRAG